MSDDWSKDAHGFVTAVRRAYRGDKRRPKGRALVHVRCAKCGQRAATLEITDSGALVVLETASGERFAWLSERGPYVVSCPEHGALDVSVKKVADWWREAHESDKPAQKRAKPHALSAE